jgi:hypothetical protein
MEALTVILNTQVLIDERFLKEGRLLQIRSRIS